MVAPPGFVLRATRGDRDDVVGQTSWRARLLSLTDRIRSAAPPDHRPPAVCWRTERELCPHAGLGSGTQLGLAAAKALSLLAGEPEVTPVELARRSNRGLRSAVGLHGFTLGGLLIEGGKRSAEAISPLVTRVPLPDSWRVVLIRPRDAVGLSGAEERQKFADLGPMPAVTTDRLCRLALLDIAPAVIEGDFDEFTTALSEFGRLVGEYFAPVQGGVYAAPQIRAFVEDIGALRNFQLCQSSWGPTVFAFCRNLLAAESIVTELAPTARAANLEVTIAEPLNHGATIEIID